ncbi:MAG: Cdc6/Cdc18 family protein [Candidatus Helarchaeota archaeon]
MVAEAFNSLDEIFDKFLNNKNRIFKNREVLQHTFIPHKLYHREEQYNTIFSTIKRGYGRKNSFLLCYGASGTGKTSLIMSLLDKISKKCKERGFQDIITSVINCRVTTTNYRILTQLCKQIGLRIPPRCNFAKLFYHFKNAIESKNQFIILALDEIDKLWCKRSKKANNLENFLIKMNNHTKNSNFCIIGITNDPNFKDFLSEEFTKQIISKMCVFHPYNAIELHHILHQRVKLGIYPGVVSNVILKLIAALSTQTGGDARFALCLLTKACELAERKGVKIVTEEYVRTIFENLKNRGINNSSYKNN